MAALKGINLGDVLEVSAAGVITPTLHPDILTMLTAIQPQCLRLEFRLAGAAGWNAPGLLDAYAQQIRRIKGQVGANVLILGEITYQSVPQSDQLAWNAQFTEPDPAPSPSMNTYLVRYFDSIQAILGSTLADGTHITDLVDHWELWNEPNAWTENKRDPSGNWGADGWRPELGDPAKFDPQHLNPAAQQFLQQNNDFPLNRRTLGGTYIYPSLFATLLMGGASLIHQLQPAAVVVAGGLFGFNLHTPGQPDTVHTGLEYVQEVIGHLQTVPKWLDGWGQHLYFTGNDALGANRSQDLLKTQKDCLSALNDFLAHKRTGARPALQYYVTEAGFASKPADGNPNINAQSAADCGTLYAACAATQDLHSLYWFTLQDTAQIKSGLIDIGGTWKPDMEAAFQAPL
jgi:hypothetical protein